MPHRIGEELGEWKSSHGTREFIEVLRGILTENEKARVVVLESVDQTALQAAFYEGRRTMIEEIIAMIQEKERE